MKPTRLRNVCGRREFLQAAALGSVPLLAGARFDQPAGRPADVGMIVRESEPLNLEFPFASLDGFITPNERFYVRNHFAMPKLDTASWRLRVEGAVERPLELTYEDLSRMPARKVTALLECAGNSRVFLSPKVRGVAWQMGAVGNAEWTGVPLAALLERAGVRSGAVEVVLEGADRGEIKDDPKSPGVIAFSRSLPLSRTRDADVLLAYRMNGAELPHTHGYPLRAIVPGWYGMASVKWLTRLVVVKNPFEGFFQSLDYTYWKRTHGLPSLVPITDLQVKAAIARPAMYEVLQSGQKYRVFGAAWTGGSEVTSVQVSDDGKSWANAKLLGGPVPHAWRLWEYEWTIPTQPGRYALMARANDKLGRSQPLHHDQNRRTYQISHVLPIEVEVR